MDPSKQSAGDFLPSSIKNSIRGALSNKFRRGFGKRASVLEALSSAIDKLPDGSLPWLAAWIEQFAAKRERIYPPARVGEYDDLCPQTDLRFVDLSKALHWLTIFLSKQAEIIGKYLGLLGDYEDYFCSGDFSAALVVLDRVEAEIGLSVWLIEARILTLTRVSGLETQKEYALSVHKAAPSSVPSFLAHFTSQRNEDGFPIDRFLSRTRARIESQKVSDAVKAYIRIRLTGVDSASEQDLCDYLSLSFTSSVVDAYEAFLDSAQTIFRSPDLRNQFNRDVQRMARVLQFQDWRLAKLRQSRGEDSDPPIFHDSTTDEAFLKGQLSTAIDSALTYCLGSRLDVDAIAVAAHAAALADSEPSAQGLPPLSSELFSLFSAVRGGRGSAAHAANSIRKAALNLRSLRIAGAIYGHLTRAWHETPQVGLSSATSIYVSTPYLNVQHWLWLPRKKAASLIRDAAGFEGEGLVIRTARAQLQNDRLNFPELDPDVRLNLEVEAALYHGDLDRALDASRRMKGATRPAWRRLATKYELYCILARGDFDAAIRTVASYCCENEDIRYSSPLRTLLTGKKWKHLQHLKADISLPIVLDIYWRTIDEIEHFTNRRIAYDEFLKAAGCSRPSELLRCASSFEKQELIYFLSSVAVPEVMDVSFNVFKTSRSLQEERIRVCSLLSELDPVNSSRYADELKNITAALSIEDGLRDVDRSRVHVNIEAVARWAQRQLGEEFGRYKGLRKAGVGFGSPEEFLFALKKTAAGDHSYVENLLNYPEQEGDDLLLTIVEAIKNEYLTNSDYGLDAYLSMRVRHGSLAGHMRGPLEELNLIVPKGDVGSKYQENSVLADQQHVRAEERDRFFEAFRLFSAAYDHIIEELTKLKLQIRSSDRPDGMFAVDFSRDPILLQILGNGIDENTEFSRFIDQVIGLISTELQGSLALVRDYIRKSVKPEIEKAFEALRSSLQHGVSGGTYVALNSLIADGMRGVQAAVDRIAEWFDPVEKKESAVRSFEQLVQIGIEATRNARRGFSPQFQLDIEDTNFQLIGLSDFTHILFTILDNVWCHSGNKVSPWVSIRLWTELVDAELSLKLRVESEAVEGTVSDAAREKLTRIRQQMESGEYRQHVNREGRSGLFKLKRFVAMDSRQLLDFGFMADRAFFVEIHLLPLMINRGLSTGAGA